MNLSFDLIFGIMIFSLAFLWSIFELKRGWKILVRGEESFNYLVRIRLWHIDKYGNESDKEKFLEELSKPSDRHFRGCAGVAFFLIVMMSAPCMISNIIKELAK